MPFRARPTAVVDVTAGRCGKPKVFTILACRLTHTRSFESSVMNTPQILRGVSVGVLMASCLMRPDLVQGFDGRHLKADLRGRKLGGAELEEVDLSGADLRGTDLSGANLADASLKEARVEGASFIGANLTGVNLFGVRLSEVRLLGANLRDADLTHLDADFDLEFVELVGVQMEGARLKDGVVCGGLPAKGGWGCAATRPEEGD